MDSSNHLEKISLPYSKKDIGLPSKFQYQKRLTYAIEKFCRNLGWTVFFLMHPDEKDDNIRWFGFKSGRAPPPEAQKEIEPFVQELTSIVGSIKFDKKYSNPHQKRLRAAVSTIRKCEKVIVAGDKTRNFYAMEKRDYNQLLQNKITEDYKVVSQQDVDRTNDKSFDIATKLGLADKMEVYPENPCFLTLKDTKDNFNTKSNTTKPARLINAAKTDVGRVSRILLQEINAKIRLMLGLNQWQSSKDAIEWFKAITNKQDKKFFVYDVVDFYPSICEETLKKALDWASLQTDVSIDDRNVIMHARASFLWAFSKIWAKKKCDNFFDNPQGSNDGAEVAELVGLFMLNQILEANIGFDKSSIGLYRDDGLCAVRGSGRQLDVMRKKLESIFKKNGFGIKVELGMKSVNFLDITFHLESGKYEPFRKDPLPPIYVHNQSNHPRIIKKNLPKGIEKRVSSLCSDEDTFNRHKGLYEGALKEAGYNYQMQYSRPPEKKTTNKKRWPVHIYFNPPFSMNVRTDVGRQFLGLVKKHFPMDGKWGKTLNIHTLKLSYSCMNNLGKEISSHNRKILSDNEGTQDPPGCNCTTIECPLENHCLVPCCVYQGLLSSGPRRPTYNYFGLAGNTFKERYQSHKTSFENPDYKGSTTLSTKFWELKEKGYPADIQWKILHTTKPYKAGMKSCDVCLLEKTRILLGRKGPEKLARDIILLNRRTEVTSKCRHKLKYTLETDYKKRHDPPKTKKNPKLNPP